MEPIELRSRRIAPNTWGALSLVLAALFLWGARSNLEHGNQTSAAVLFGLVTFLTLVALLLIGIPMRTRILVTPTELEAKSPLRGWTRLPRSSVVGVQVRHQLTGGWGGFVRFLVVLNPQSWLFSGRLMDGREDPRRDPPTSITVWSTDHPPLHWTWASAKANDVFDWSQALADTGLLVFHGKRIPDEVLARARQA